MKARPEHASASVRLRSSSNVATSVLRSLQSENDSLRSDLLQTRQLNKQLQHQLHQLRSNAERMVADATVSSREQVQVLEGRCRLLADRLLASRRDEQVSETARISFVLRSQQEERRFLKRALQAMLETLVGAADSAASSVQSAPVTPKPDDGDMHTGTLYHLMMRVSDDLLAHMASTKLEKAGIRLRLEQAGRLLKGLTDALEDATRTAYNASQSAGSAEEATFSELLTPAHDTPVYVAETHNGTMSDGGGSSLRRRGSASNFAAVHAAPPQPLGSSTAGRSSKLWQTTSASARLTAELAWVCDVLKACLRGAEEVVSLVAAAEKELVAPPLLLRHRAAGDRASTCDPAKHLAAVASPEMNALLQSFLEDLHTIKRQAAQHQEDMARQLAEEVERHYCSTQQYGQRIRLLESECARALHRAEQLEKKSDAKDKTSPPRHTSSAMSATESRPTSSPSSEARVTPERYEPIGKENNVSSSRQSPTYSSPLSVRPRRHGREETSILREGVDSRPVSRAWIPRTDLPTLTDAKDSMSLGPSTVWRRRLQGSASHPSRLPKKLTGAVEPSTRLFEGPGSWDKHHDHEQLPPQRVSVTSPSSLSPRMPLVSPAMSSTQQNSSKPIAEYGAGALSTRSLLRRSVTMSSPSLPQGTAPFTEHSVSNTSSTSATSSRNTPTPHRRTNSDGITAHPYTRRYTPLSAARQRFLDPSPEREGRDLHSPHSSGASLGPPRGGQVSDHQAPLSQHLYNEAAADVFSSDSSVSPERSSALLRGRRSQPDASHKSEANQNALMRTPSPQKSARFTSRVAHPIPADARSTVGQRRTLILTSPTAPLRPVRAAASAMAALSPAELESTPPLWRRIREEVSSQQQERSPSLVDDGSVYFGTPYEATWTESGEGASGHQPGR